MYIEMDIDVQNIVALNNYYYLYDAEPNNVKISITSIISRIFLKKL